MEPLVKEFNQGELEALEGRLVDGYGNKKYFYDRIEKIRDGIYAMHFSRYDDIYAGEDGKSILHELVEDYYIPIDKNGNKLHNEHICTTFGAEEEDRPWGIVNNVNGTGRDAVLFSVQVADLESYSGYKTVVGLACLDGDGSAVVKRVDVAKSDFEMETTLVGVQVFGEKNEFVVAALNGPSSTRAKLIGINDDLSLVNVLPDVDLHVTVSNDYSREKVHYFTEVERYEGMSWIVGAYVKNRDVYNHDHKSKVQWPEFVYDTRKRKVLHMDSASLTERISEGFADAVTNRSARYVVDNTKKYSAAELLGASEVVKDLIMEVNKAKHSAEELFRIHKEAYDLGLVNETLGCSKMVRPHRSGVLTRDDIILGGAAETGVFKHTLRYAEELLTAVDGKEALPACRKAYEAGVSRYSNVLWVEFCKIYDSLTEAYEEAIEERRGLKSIFISGKHPRSHKNDFANPQEAFLRKIGKTPARSGEVSGIVSNEKVVKCVGLENCPYKKEAQQKAASVTLKNAKGRSRKHGKGI